MRYTLASTLQHWHWSVCQPVLADAQLGKSSCRKVRGPIYGDSLPAPGRVRIALDDAGATYPVVVDPLLIASPDTQLEADQASADLGRAVASAGALVVLARVVGIGADDHVAVAVAVDVAVDGRGMAAPDRIQIDPKVMLGKPVIRGTRITVELLLRKLGEGASEADLLDAYPQLTRDDLQAAMTYAADTLAHEENLIIKPSR